MNPNAPASTNDEILNSIIKNGDLSKLSADQKVFYYRLFCEKLGLDPLSQPFKLLRLNGKEILYCDRSGTQQLCKMHNVSHTIVSREIVLECYVVTAQAKTPDGRQTESIGAAPIQNLTGEGLCNAMMKAETKAKRRATLDLLGLGILDETETNSFPNQGTVPTPVSMPPAPEISEKEAKKNYLDKLHSELAQITDDTVLANFYREREEEFAGVPEIINMIERRSKEIADEAIFKAKYEPQELEKTLKKVDSIANLSHLYYTNMEAIEGKDGVVLKALFAAKKIQINNQYKANAAAAATTKVLKEKAQ